VKIFAIYENPEKSIGTNRDDGGIYRRMLEKTYISLKRERKPSDGCD
jgi:hypothetical protein